MQSESKVMPNRKGNTHSEETKAKMRASHAKRPKRPQTDETKEKIRQARIGTTVSDEARKKISATQTGKPLSAAHRAAIGKGQRESTLAREVHSKVGKAHRGKRVSEKTRQLLSNARQGIKASPETRQKLSEAQQRRWRSYNDEQRTEVLDNWRRPFYADTSIERAAKAVLDAMGVMYEQQKHIGKYWADFYIPSRNLVLECDGDYWHGLPKQQAWDAERDSWLREQGYDVRRILGSQITDDAEKAVRDALQ
jgi:very-short-patch-repair endonuclease